MNSKRTKLVRKGSAPRFVSLISFLAVALLPLLASAQLTYTTNNANITITGYTGSPTDVTIPSAINGYPVTRIGESAFSFQSSLTNVTIPNSIISIGNYAFEDCRGLTSITIPDSVTSLGIRVLAFCHSLKNVALGNNITNVEDSTFYECFSLTNVTIAASVTRIGSHAFASCTSLTSVTIGNTVTSIGETAFAFCTSLTNVTIPASTTNIGYKAFASCTSLTNITVDAGNPTYSSIHGVVFNKAQTTLILFPVGRGGSYIIPAGVTSIGSDAFSGCVSLMSVMIPNSVTNIGGYAFFACAGLTSITIGNGVATIGPAALMGCSHLTSVLIPSSVTMISGEVFKGCYNLTNITVAAANPSYGSHDGVLFNKAQTWLIDFPEGKGGNYLLPAGVTNIGNEAFFNCGRLTSVMIPGSLISIGNYAFFGCVGLTNATIRHGVTRLGYWMFASCESLTSVTIPASVTNIGSYAFGDCSSLTNLTFVGNRPILGGSGDAFSGVAAGAKVYYYYGTLGWGTTYGGLPTVMLNPPPQIGAGSASVQPGGYFGFTVTGGTNQTIVVEASTNLTTWQPIWTNVLSGASINFTDAQWTNYPSRFYRVR